MLAGTEVHGIAVAGGRVRSVTTSAGEIETDNVVICCGVWSPRIARMAGARLALTPTVHQMISVGPIALFADTPGEISYPIVRDVDTNMYERQHGGDMEVGSYAHRPIIVAPDEIPSIEESVLSPTEMPFTQEDFDPQLEQALELMPELLGDEKAGIRYAINGLISMTPDGHPLLGEMPEAKGLWSAAASWIKEGPGCGRAVAELMSGQVPTVDVHEADAARFYPHQQTVAHVRGRAREGFNKMYGIVHPAEQWESGRPVRVGPAYERERALGAVFYETAGWERPFWYASNEPLLERYAGRLMERTAEWESRWWSPVINAEHLAMRDAAALVDLSAFAVLDISGPAALDAVQNLSVAQMNLPVGRVVYTSWLDENGGFRADLTVMRLAEDRFRVVTGGATGMSDAAWIRRHLPPGAFLADLTSAWTTIGLWGPRARDVLAAVTADDVARTRGSRSAPAARSRSAGSWCSRRGSPTWASSAGNCTCRSSRACGCGTRCGRPASRTGWRRRHRGVRHHRAAGEGVPGVRRRADPGLHAGRGRHDPAQGEGAGLHRQGGVPAAAFRAAVRGDVHADRGLARVGGRVAAVHAGRRADPVGRGERLVDAKGRPSYVTSAGSGPSVGRHLLMAYLPAWHAVEGNSLLVEYMGEQYPVTVARASATPLFDPENARIRS